MTLSRCSVRATLAALILWLGQYSVTNAHDVIAARPDAGTACFANQTQKGEPAAFIALYRWTKGRWTCAHALYLGDRIQLILRFKWRPNYSGYYRSGWNHPSARVLIRNNDNRYVLGNYTAGKQGLFYVSPSLPSTRLPDGFIRFSVDVDIPRETKWVGRRRMEFLVAKGNAPSNFTNSSALYEFFIDPVPSILARIPAR
jgi:hypothetical protein